MTRDAHTMPIGADLYRDLVDVFKALTPFSARSQGHFSDDGSSWRMSLGERVVGTPGDSQEELMLPLGKAGRPLSARGLRRVTAGKNHAAATGLQESGRSCCAVAAGQ